MDTGGMGHRVGMDTGGMGHRVQHGYSGGHRDRGGA